MDRVSYFPKLYSALLLAAQLGLAQGFSFGLRGGVPVGDSLKILDAGRYSSDRAPFVVGPAVELHLVGGVSAGADLLYRRIQYSSLSAEGSSRTTGQAWDIPVMGRFRLPGALFRPFLEAGITWRRLARFEQRTTAGAPLAVNVTKNPPELVDRSTSGPTLGGGVELQAPLVRISAGLRYTRWSSSSFRSALVGLATQLNQADFLLGIMF